MTIPGSLPVCILIIYRNISEVQRDLPAAYACR